jgi:hypothetical protein
MGQPKRYRLDVYDDASARQGTILARDLTEAKITKETNGVYMLGFSTPIDAAPGENGLIVSRWQAWVYDLDAEAAGGGYLPRKFRMQRISRVQDATGKMVFKVEAEHILFDMLSEVISTTRVVANLTANEILDELLASSTFTKDTTDDFLQKFFVDEFTIGGVVLNCIYALVEKVDGRLQVTDDLKVNILPKKVIGTDAVSARATTRYNLLQLQREDDSRRLVTRMYGLGGGEPRLTLAGTWHPCAQAYNSLSGVAVHKLAPNNDAFEPRDSGTASVVRYFLEFRVMPAVYWPIKKFVARGAIFGGGADFIEVEIRDLDDALGWTQLYDVLNGVGDFCRLWYDRDSQFVGGWSAPLSAPPTMDPLAAQAPPDFGAGWQDCVKMALGSNKIETWISGIGRERNALYMMGNNGNFFYWDDDGNDIGTWSAERNEAPGTPRSARGAYHTDYGVLIIGYTAVDGIRSRQIPKVDHYTVDAGSDETDVKTITSLSSAPTGADNNYMTDVCRRGDEFVAIGAQEHAGDPGHNNALRKAIMTDLGGTPTWSSAVHVLNTPEDTAYLKVSDASHPGGSGMAPKIQDAFVRCDDPLGGGLHYLLRFAYDDGGSDNSGHIYYQYDDNEGEYLTDLDNFYASSNANPQIGYCIPSVKRGDPETVVIAYWEHIRNAANDHDMNLKCLRRSGPQSGQGGGASTWTVETVASWTGLTDAQFNNWGFNDTLSNGKGNTYTDVVVDHAFDTRGNEHIVYSRDDGSSNKDVYYRFRDNSVASPTWGSETKISNGSAWVAANFDPNNIDIVKENGYVNADPGAYLTVVWSAQDVPSVFNWYGFVAQLTFGDDPTPGDGIAAFDADVVLIPAGGYPTDCGGTDLSLQKVDWIEERDTTNVPALAGYERFGFIDGVVDEESLEFTENLFDDAFLSRLDYAAGLHPFVNDIGNGSPAFSKNSDRTYIKNGQYSQKVVTTAANEGCYLDFDMSLASNCSDYFSIRVLIYLEAGGEVQLDVSEGDAGSWATRGTQTVFPTNETSENAVKVTRTGFVEIQFSGIERRGGNAGRIWFYQPSTTGATYYIDSIQVEPLTAPSAEWIETSTRRLLWSRVYDALVKVNGIKKTYRTNMRDLEIEGINPYDQFSDGDIIEVENEELGVPKTELLVDRKTEDLLDPGNVEVDIASRLDRTSDHAASLYARVAEQSGSIIRSVRKQVRERLRLGPPKVGMIVRPDEPENMDTRTTILDGTDDPYP